MISAKSRSTVWFRSKNTWWRWVTGDPGNSGTVTGNGAFLFCTLVNTVFTISVLQYPVLIHFYTFFLTLGTLSLWHSLSILAWFVWMRTLQNHAIFWRYFASPNLFLLSQQNYVPFRCNDNNNALLQEGEFLWNVSQLRFMPKWQTKSEEISRTKICEMCINHLAICYPQKFWEIEKDTLLPIPRVFPNFHKLCLCNEFWFRRIHVDWII